MDIVKIILLTVAIWGWMLVAIAWTRGQRVGWLNLLISALTSAILFHM